MAAAYVFEYDSNNEDENSDEELEANGGFYFFDDHCSSAGMPKQNQSLIMEPLASTSTRNII